MRRAFPFALCCLLLAGCATRSHSPSASGTKGAPPHDPHQVVPSPVQVIGRVLAVDLRTLSVMVDVSPYTVLPPDFRGRILIVRTDDLRPTARLEASPYLLGRTLGTRLLAGQPQVGQEVVLPPATP